MQSTSSASRSTPYPFQRERRATLRISEPFPVRVRGTNAVGSAFDEATSLSNLSAGGLYATVSHQVEVGTPLFALMRLSNASASDAAPCVAVRGTVLRVERCDEAYGVAVKFSQHRFL